jgi:O-antigen/teichoic acid export membrane protein
MSVSAVVLGTRNVSRDGVVWNSVASLASALQAYVMMWVAKATLGLDEAGVLSLAAAAAYIFWTIGGYNMRRFQVSDVTGRFPFRAYCWSRGITIAAMVVACLGYLVVRGHGGYDGEKLAVIALVTLLRVVDVGEDVVYGQLQLRGHLHAAGRVSTARFVAVTVAYCVVVVATRDLVVALVVSIVASVALLALEVLLVRSGLDSPAGVVCRRRDVGRLLVECFPLFAAGLLLMYLTNAPKYSIDAALPDPDAIQGVFGFLVMPIFVISLVSGFIYNPMVVTMATRWHERAMRPLLAMLGRVTAAIVAMTVVAAVVGYAIGMPVLSWLFRIDLHAYRWQFAVLIVGGGLTALTGFASLVLTVVRRQMAILVANLVLSGGCLLIANAWVSRWGIDGACTLSAVIAGAQTVVLVAVLAVVFLRSTATAPRAAAS